VSRCPFCLSIVSLALAICITLSCGGGGSRQLQSITVSPPSADARNYPQGQVRFIATGHYNSSPATVTPLQANWAGISEFTVNGMLTYGPVTDAISLDNTGVAHCAAGASGTYAVVAWDLQDPGLKVGCSSVTDFGEPGCNAVQSIAQLTCP
jgi:hypothetical protein